MNAPIDLRSDTVTQPSKAMLEFMFSAKTGDDVFNEDPSIIELEEKTAKLFGKEAGLFCPSGTMTNQIAINIHTRPGDEVICDITSHIYNFEGGGIAKNSGVQAKSITGIYGQISAKQVSESINLDFDWLAKTGLVEVENTVNKAGGGIYKLENLKEIKAVCEKNNLPFHLDGARIFNAIVESDYSAVDIGNCFDTLSICLSKGLGAPVGSLLLGTKKHIKEARRVRKVFGGGMRQAGILAAAGIYALDNNITRLKEDHAKAKHLAACMKQLPYMKNVIDPETNILIFTLNDDVSSLKFTEHLTKHNLKTAGFGPQTFRFVTHMDILDGMTERACEILKKFN